MTGSSRLTSNDIFSIAKDGYLYELGMLVRITKSEYFRELLPRFSDYENFLSGGKDQYFGANLAQHLINHAGFVDANEESVTCSKLFSCVNLSALCEIFGGWTIPVAELESHRVGEYLQMALSHGAAGQANLGGNMAVRLNNGDAVRVVQILKLLGLLPVNTSILKQLSLGASIGKRDRHAFHLIPVILSALPGFPPTPQSPLKFGVKPSQPSDVVLIDNDPALKPVYNKMNTEDKKHILGMNTDFYEGMDNLHKLIKAKQAAARNLVVAFRLAPQAFPDVKFFLTSVSKVIEESAHFVTTIGAGDNVDEFNHRLTVIHELHDNLSKIGMSPIRIKCYNGETPEQQRENPLFGLSHYASYEVLYCKLEKSKLSRLSNI